MRPVSDQHSYVTPPKDSRTPNESPPAAMPVATGGWRGLVPVHAGRAFQHRNYRLFFAGQLLSLMGTWMQTVAQSWLIYQLTGSAVLLGAAILGAVAANSHSSVLEAMRAMTRPARVVEPGGLEHARYHEARHRVFQRLYHDQKAYRALMTF